MGSFFFGVLVFAFYFIPSFIGWNHKNQGAIVAINIFLGWTFVGWVVALVWALTDGSTNKIVVTTEKSNIEDLKLLKELHGDGTLTDEEFQKEKKRILNNK